MPYVSAVCLIIARRSDDRGGKVANLFFRFTSASGQIVFGIVLPMAEKSW